MFCKKGQDDEKDKKGVYVETASVIALCFVASFSTIVGCLFYWIFKLNPWRMFFCMCFMFYILPFDVMFNKDNKKIGKESMLFIMLSVVSWIGSSLLLYGLTIFFYKGYNLM